MRPATLADVTWQILKAQRRIVAGDDAAVGYLPRAVFEHYGLGLVSEHYRVRILG